MPRDIDNIVRQFHLPSEVPFFSFDSYPKQAAGFFGREGMSISAKAGFTDKQFDSYHKSLDNSSVWKPTSFPNYSPGRAEIYSEDALKWKELPVPNEVQERFKNWRLIEGAMKIEKGKYFCYAIVTRRGSRMAHNPNAFYWNRLALSCSEIPEQEYATIKILGVLSFEKRQLYARIEFSG